MRTPAYLLGFVLGAYTAQGAHWLIVIFVAVCAVDLVRWALVEPRRGGYITGGRS